jgi:hypothetical protein
LTSHMLISRRMLLDGSPMVSDRFESADLS